MTLQELLSCAGIDPIAVEGDAPLSGICSDSRKATPGCIFVCMPSGNSDSHSFLAAAKKAGAVAAIAHSDSGFEAARALGLAALQLSHGDRSSPTTPDTQPLRPQWAFNDALCKICNVFFDYPTRNMKVVGVTGTNGKTTVAWLIRDMLRAMGMRAAYLGTLGFHLPLAPPGARSREYEIEERELANTTPFPVELYMMLAEARDRGVEALAMEVSSHALAERRCDYVEFDVGVFTNLTQDHMDFHGTMEAYEAAKLRLFTEIPKQTAKRFVGALNMDADGMYERFLKINNETETWLYSIENGGWDLQGQPVFVAVDRIDMRLWDKYTHVGLPLDDDDAEWREVSVRLGGEYNVENVLSATAGLGALGYHLPDLCDHGADVFGCLRPVPGRFEAVPNDEGIAIIVDYAHTPDALEKLLGAVRPLTKGRVITVFGCGGDRDRNKRPKMAKAASERSDVTIITSDNPRTEDPQAIIAQILPGIEEGKEHAAIIDRGQAVGHAIEIARPGDVVVIAGKGHENYQIVGRTKYPMDDRELAREGLRRRALGVGR